ncbi:limonene-1,2-epoxide hydrolase family protein [Nocardia cyriacigeorgica]|uniref:limonene-1,2-epoxide hydrolase family protein n=1 Tax=Nocardia cyriacigeorgica TaxID=135487 RepID=UPI0018947029|nr:limonene-1,2-epoxide hydrolase family protein [Nocardia cyriacigeorgica]MBF6436846.1 nuclear transport factor 2 family protein [Nocardia cyriacigeorgica]MBF6452414.1 nuclear transport factor 2 family protein [Nocardia cyriacigeorgica]MBF6480960.1 nuclear transport factor 2 family protein [Nocardia cyriacigeorgica]MBF6549583.1 nuclear transport factor 2 family protein [Nocardia cyriacigeorgica]
MSEIELEQDSITTVREFFAALEIGAVSEALELLHPDIVWKNTSLPDVRGERRVAQVLRGLSRDQFGFAAIMHHIAADGPIVLTDRTDILRFGPVRISFWVAGTFELRDGRIILWHDHFSWENFLRGVVAGVFKAVFSRG